MYQNIQPNQRPTGYYPNQYSGYQSYNTSAEYSQMPITAYPPQCGNFLKGRPVVSIEEARAAQIDLDGSIFVFTDIGNKKIYTKQLNLDGTATLKTYIFTEDEIPTNNQEYVTMQKRLQQELFKVY